MEKRIQYTKPMYEYLAWRLFRDMYGATEWAEDECCMIDQLIKKARKNLDKEQVQIVDNRALRMKNEYEEWMLHSLQKRYWHELEDDYDEDDDFGGFVRFDVDYNEDHYNIWTKAVRQRLIVKMKYDSTSSGITERLIDPYKTSTPYGEGYCHNRKEVRKFRFDRIINIELTDKKFDKLDNWQAKKMF